MLNILAPILLALTPVEPTLVKVNVVNAQHIQTIGGRDVTFGVKENVEELLIEKGILLLIPEQLLMFKYQLIVYILPNNCLTLWVFNGYAKITLWKPQFV